MLELMVQVSCYFMLDPMLQVSFFLKIKSQMYNSREKMINKQQNMLKQITNCITGIEIEDITSSIRLLYQLIEALLYANNQQLVTLSLTNLDKCKSLFLNIKWEVVEQLKILLKNQRKLKVLDLSEAGLSLDEGQ